MSKDVTQNEPDFKGLALLALIYLTSGDVDAFDMQAIEERLIPAGIRPEQAHAAIYWLCEGGFVEEIHLPNDVRIYKPLKPGLRVAEWQLAAKKWE